MTSTTQQGKELEQYIAGEIRKKGLDKEAARDPRSGAGNKDKRDVRTKAKFRGRCIGFECKNQARPNMKQWMEQTDQLASLGYEPALAYKLPGESLESTKVVIYLDTFLEMLADFNKPRLDNQSKELYWAIIQLLNASKKVNKIINPYKK